MQNHRQPFYLGSLWLVLSLTFSNAAFVTQVPTHYSTATGATAMATMHSGGGAMAHLTTSRVCLAVTSPVRAHVADDLESPRRRFLGNGLAALLSVGWTLRPTARPALAVAAERIPLEDLLYRILRVREATQQETRLIKTGKFKDLQRANVKLAVKFMLDNYRLGDAFIAASTYLEGGTQRRIEAGQVGQTAVQSLYTILEYFDSSDVQNIKVGSDSMSGKEGIVLKGLDAARESIDDFLAFFPASVVDSVKAKVRQENELNVKEFDPSLGTIINMPTP